MIVEIIVHDGDYPNGNSWKYGFSSVEEAIDFLKNDKEHLQILGGLTSRALDLPSATMCKCGASGYESHKRWCPANTASQ